MIDWVSVIENDYPAPSDADEAVGELLQMLTSPDPVVRDRQAYSVLARWIRRGVLDNRLAGLGDSAAQLFAHPEVQARTFAPLILASAINRDTAIRRAGMLDEATVARWREAFTAWWPAETEIRGWDGELGWLHAVAHGADLAEELGDSPHTGAEDLTALLTLVARRVVAPTAYQYAHMEEDRVAGALAKILARPELTEAAATAWLGVIDQLFATGAPGPLPVPVANTLAVLRAAYVMADRKALPHGRAVTDAIAARLHLVFSAYPATRE
jgi:hypothetical protein